MKDNVCRRDNEELLKALKEATKLGRTQAMIIRRKDKEYQQLYIEYIDLKKRLGR